MNAVNSMKFLMLVILALLALFMLMTMFFGSKALALLRYLTPQASRDQAKTYLLPLAITGSVFVGFIFVLGILMITSHHRYTDPACHILISLLFGISVLITALAWAAYAMVKDIGSMSFRDIHKKTDAAASACRWIVMSAISGICIAFVALLMLNAESQHTKIFVPFAIVL